MWQWTLHQQYDMCRCVLPTVKTSLLYRQEKGWTQYSVLKSSACWQQKPCGTMHMHTSDVWQEIKGSLGSNSSFQ